MTAWSHIDTLRAAERVREASRRAAVVESYRATGREAAQLDEGLAAARHELAELTAMTATAAARATTPRKPTGRQRSRERSRE